MGTERYKYRLRNRSLPKSFFQHPETLLPPPPLLPSIGPFWLIPTIQFFCTSFQSGTSVIFAEMATSDSSNDHLVKSDDNQHPANLIPELCKKFWTLGWVTGKNFAQELAE